MDDVEKARSNQLNMILENGGKLSPAQAEEKALYDSLAPQEVAVPTEEVSDGGEVEIKEDLEAVSEEAPVTTEEVLAEVPAETPVEEVPASPEAIEAPEAAE